MPERLVIRSYRRVFEVDRRLYRVDRWAVPVPGGVPLRAVAYFIVTVLAMIVLGRVPGVSALVGALSSPLRFVIVPLAVAVLGTQAAPDGRTAHRFAWGWLQLRIRSRRRCAGRTVALAGEPVPWDGQFAVRPDEHETRLARGRVTGPARVTFSGPVSLETRGARVVARPAEQGQLRRTVVVCSGVVLEVRP